MDADEMDLDEAKNLIHAGKVAEGRPAGIDTFREWAGDAYDDIAAKLGTDGLAVLVGVLDGVAVRWRAAAAASSSAAVMGAG